LTESVTVYGFGSFFKGKARPRDIDLLLVHRSTGLASSMFAIDCKAQIKSELPAADVVMLSQAEAESLDFLERAKAIKLGHVSAANMVADVRSLVARLLER